MKFALNFGISIEPRNLPLAFLAVPRCVRRLYRHISYAASRRPLLRQPRARARTPDTCKRPERFFFFVVLLCRARKTVDPRVVLAPNRPISFRCQCTAERGPSSNPPIEDVYQPVQYDGSREWSRVASAEKVVATAHIPGESWSSTHHELPAQRGREALHSWRQEKFPYEQGTPRPEAGASPRLVLPRTEEAGVIPGTAAARDELGDSRGRSPSPISAVPAVVVDTGPTVVVSSFPRAFDGGANRLRKTFPATPAEEGRAFDEARLPPPAVVAEDFSSRRAHPPPLSRGSSLTDTAANFSPPSFEPDQTEHPSSRGRRGGGRAGDIAAAGAAERVLGLRRGISSASQVGGVKRARGIEEAPPEAVGVGVRSVVARHNTNAAGSGGRSLIRTRTAGRRCVCS